MLIQNGLRLPDFIGIGPPRTATTWLNGVLATRVGLPADVKETDFFSYHYSYGLPWYAAHFRHCAPESIVGEFSPNYFHSKVARERMGRDLPWLRIICTLRDPVERLYSHYRLKTRFYVKSTPLSVALREDPELVSASRYAHHLEQWIEMFGPSRVYTAFYDQLEYSPQQFVDSICAFLRVPTIDLERSPATQRKGIKNEVRYAPAHPRLAAAANRLKFTLQTRGYGRAVRMLRKAKLWHWCSRPGREFPPLPPEMDCRLRDVFRPDVERLEQLLGLNLGSWKSGFESDRPNSPDSEGALVSVVPGAPA